MTSIEEFLGRREKTEETRTAEIARLKARIDNLTTERNEARASAAVAHGAIRRLAGIVASDQSFTRLSKHLRGSIGSCLEAADPEVYEALAEEMNVMYIALETIARQNNGDGQVIAQNALERLSQ